MVELNHRQRTIKVKVVYYGPAVGGKTTNLQVLHANANPARRGELVSIHSAQDRTILFDLLPLKAAGFRGFDLRLQLAAVPGQAMYAATRRLVLKGADSVVFVANSAADRWDENVQSFREMADNLIAHQLDPASLPLVLQFNKRDLPEVTPIDFMERALNARHVPAIPAVAVRGEGVLETFGAVLAATMEDLAVRYQVVDLGRGQPLQKWVQQALIDLFGGTTLAAGSAAEGAGAPRPESFLPAAELPAEDRRSMRVDLPEDALRLAAFGPSARANESLVESYADVTTRMGAELSDLRDQKERLRRWLDQLHRLVGAAHDLMAGQPREATLRQALEPLIDAAGSRHGSLLVPAEGELPRPIALRGLQEDPLLRLSSGRRILERLLHEAEPRLHHSADSLDLGEALQEGSPSFVAVASLPLTAPAGPQALGLFYFSGDEVLPGAGEMAQLKALASVLSPALQLSAQQDRGRSADRSGELALMGLAALRGLEDVLAGLLELRDGLAAVRRDPSFSNRVLSALGQVTPGLVGALDVARALLAFGRGEPPPGEVAELADILPALPGVDVSTEPPPPAVRADPALLKLALTSLADHLRGGDGRGRVAVRVKAKGGQVKVKLAGAVTRAADLRVALAERILEQQRGTLGQEVEDGRPWTVLTLNAV